METNRNQGAECSEFQQRARVGDCVTPPIVSYRLNDRFNLQVV